jgi:hypothetical protein
VVPRVEADRVVGRGEYHTLDALFACGLEQIVAADDVGLQDRIPGALDRIAAEMQDAVDALADRLDLRHVGKIGCLEFLVLAEIGRRLQVAQHQVRIDRRQQLAQARADPAGGAGHQYAWHLFPLILATDLRSLAGNDSKLKRSGNATTRTANVRCSIAFSRLAPGHLLPRSGHPCTRSAV